MQQQAIPTTGASKSFGVNQLRGRTQQCVGYGDEQIFGQHSLWELCYGIVKPPRLFTRFQLCFGRHGLPSRS